MTEGPIPGVNTSLPPENAENQSEKNSNELSRSTASSFETEEKPSENTPETLEELDGQRRIMRERPYISSRLSVPHDPVQPRGVNTFSRFAMGYSRNRSRGGFGSGLGMDEELNLDSKNQDSDSNSTNIDGGVEHPEVSSSEYDSRNAGSLQNSTFDSAKNTEIGQSNVGGGPSRGLYRQGGFRHRVNYEDRERTTGNYVNDPRGYGENTTGRPARRMYGGERGGYGERRNYNEGEATGRTGFQNRGNRVGREAYNPNPGYHGRTWRAEGWTSQENSVQGGRMNRPYRRNQEGYSPYNPAFPELNQNRSHKEPLSLAEELAEEMSRSHKATENGAEKPEEMLLQDASVGKLQRLSMQELIAEARRFEIGIPEGESAQKHDLIFRIIKEKIKLNGLLYGEGTLEILPDGFGFLRSTEFNYLSCPDDIYVSPSQIRRFGLRNGTIVSGQIRPPKENERYFALLRVEAINFRDPNEFIRRRLFEDLTPDHPNQQIRLESAADEIETRVLDMMVPIAFGQRGLIMSPAGTGKTTLLKKIARATLKNFPDIYVFLLMVDEKAEEVTKLKDEIKGQNCEIISSTFDEPTMRHIQVADMVLEKAKRMVEFGQNVLILLDSITHLSRAWHAELQNSENMAEQGASQNVLQVAKRFMGTARKIGDGGSLTILATLLTETENPADEAVYEEFKGTGNLEITLDKRLVERGIWPALDLTRSRTLHEEMIRTPEEFQKIMKLRALLQNLNPVDAMEMLTNRLRKTQNNEEFLESLK